MMDKNDNKNVAIRTISSALLDSRLSLFIGAGISQDFGLPGWDLLVEKLCIKCKITEVGIAKDRLASLCLKKVGMDEYKKKVKGIIYKSFKPLKIFNYPLLVAIGALCTSAKIRGNINQIVTYNYDNIIEQYLSYYGIVPNIISEFPYYLKLSDLTIFHPHGYLPYKSSDDSKVLVLDTKSFYLSKTNDTFWPEIETIVRHNLLLFIGISFDDRNLEELINLNYQKNPSSINDEPLGFYFIKANQPIMPAIDAKIQYLKTIHLFPIIIKEWSEMTNILAEICRRAVDLKRKFIKY